MAEREPTGLIVLLGSLTAIAPMSIDMYLPSFPVLTQALGTDAAAVQRTLSVFFIGLALGQLVYGPVSDRVGRRRPLLAGLALYTAASIGCALAGSIGQLVFWRGLQALGGCAGVVMARAVVRDVFGPREQARVLSSLLLVMGVAPILAPLVGGWLLTVAGWRAIFGVLVVFGAVTWIAVLRALPDTAPESRATTLTPAGVVAAFGRVARDGRFRRFAVAGGLGQCVLFAYIAGAPFLYIETLDLTPAAFAGVFGVNAAGLIGASQLNRALLRRAETAQVLRGALGLQVIATAALAVAASFVSPSLVTLGGPVLLAIMLLGFILPNTTALALAPFDRDAGTASALLGCLQYGMSGLATLGIAMAFDGTPRPMAMAMTLCAGAALVLAVLPGRRANQQAHPPSTGV
ncbi:MAG TPA: multidrug effflux MFS transporter [Luteitalea sp.]|nr:multidrug effflux MFS transporter [Luteitalea sp.]